MYETLVCERGCGEVEPRVDGDLRLQDWICPFCRHAEEATQEQRAVFRYGAIWGRDNLPSLPPPLTAKRVKEYLESLPPDAFDKFKGLKWNR